MKRLGHVYLLITACAISVSCLSDTGHAQTTTPTDTLTPSATPPTSPTVTAVPPRPPNVVRVWQKSIAAMVKVGQVHAVGFSTEGSNPERYTWSGDCDLPGNRVQFTVNFPAGNADNAQALATVVVGKDVWAREQRSNGTWTAWKSVTKSEEFYYFLAFMLPQVCPQLFAQNLKTFPTSLLRLVGSDSASATPTWHLRGREMHKRQSYVVNAYVDRSTSTWSRFTVKDVERNGAGSYSMDAQYSGFNLAVDIGAPTSITGTSAVHVKLPGAVSLPEPWLGRADR